MKAKIFVPSEAQPRFFKPRPSPYALKSRVKVELELLLQAKVIMPMQFSDWTASIIPVIKSDGNICRVCGDYKVTINAIAEPVVYPLPRVDNLFTALSGGTLFSKLKLSHAYHELELDEESKKYTTINTISTGTMEHNLTQVFSWFTKLLC